MDRSHRLTASYDISQTRSKGKAAAVGPLVIRVLPNRLDPPSNRYTVVAGKRIDVSRWLHESLRIAMRLTGMAGRLSRE